jgi:hypothetical protein
MEFCPFLKGEFEPSVSGPSHSEKKESDQKHISNIWVNFLSDAKHLLCSKLFNMF